MRFEPFVRRGGALVLALGVLALAVLAQAAAAQQGQPQQQTQLWNCEAGFRNTRPGQPANPVMSQFQVQINQQGGAWGQGVDSASSGSYPFQFQGNWGREGAMFIIRAPKQGGLSPELYFQSKIQSDWSMAFNHTYENGQVFASQCQRTQ